MSPPLIRNISTNRSFGLSAHPGSSFAAGVIEPQEACYFMTCSGFSALSSANARIVPGPLGLGIGGGCGTQANDANAYEDIGSQQVGDLFHATSKATISFQYSNSPITLQCPDMRANATIIGVESAAQVIYPKAPRDVSVDLFFGGSIDLVVEDSSGTQVVTFQTGFRTLSDVIGVNLSTYTYQILLYTDATIGFPRVIREDLSNWFVASEECYFEGCPAPIIQSAVVTEVTESLPASSSEFITTGSCPGFVATSKVPTPTPGDNWVQVAGNDFLQRSRITITITLTGIFTNFSAEELSQLQAVWTGETSGQSIDFSTINLMSQSQCSRKINNGQNPACLPTIADIVEVRSMSVPQFGTQVILVSYWGNESTGAQCSAPISIAPFQVGENVIPS